MVQAQARDALLVQFLSEAYVNKCHLGQSLEEHAGSTTRADYAARLRVHRAETEAHATQLWVRISQLGGDVDAAPAPRAELTRGLLGGLYETIGRGERADTAARATSEHELMLHNARLEYADEAQEIATFTVIDALANAIGDAATARLARDVLRDDRRMQRFLATLLPDLTVAFANEGTPVRA